MASLTVRISDLATRVATECKSLRSLINGNTADLSSLTTTQKSNLVSAINELKSAIDTVAAGSASINDTASTTTNTWSASKVASEIQAAKDALTNGASSALDTLAELASALGNDASFSTTVTNSLANRVRVDAAQTLNSTQQQQACTNIGIGNPDTDFVTTFTAGLV